MKTSMLYRMKMRSAYFLHLWQAEAQKRGLSPVIWQRAMIPFATEWIYC